MALVIPNSADIQKRITMPAAIDISGSRYGRLVAVQRVGTSVHGRSIWSFVCDCGNSYRGDPSAVKSGKAASCGCLRQETGPHTARKYADKIAASMTVHGHAKKRSTEYAIWTAMRQRCANPKNKDYSEYGGRGITVSTRWNRFEIFLQDMGPRPSDAHSLDRKNNSGPYSPDNCRWATHSQQANNRRPRRIKLRS